MRTYIIDTETRRMLKEVADVTSAEIEIGMMREKDIMEGYYKEGVYTIIESENNYTYWEVVSE